MNFSTIVLFDFDQLNNKMILTSFKLFLRLKGFSVCVSWLTFSCEPTCTFGKPVFSFCNPLSILRTDFGASSSALFTNLGWMKFSFESSSRGCITSPMLEVIFRSRSCLAHSSTEGIGFGWYRLRMEDPVDPLRLTLVFHVP